MPNPTPAMPYEGNCQLCGNKVKKHENYYTASIENKETYICQGCYDHFGDEDVINPTTPGILSPK